MANDFDFQSFVHRGIYLDLVTGFSRLAFIPRIFVIVDFDRKYGTIFYFMQSKRTRNYYKLVSRLLYTIPVTYIGRFPEFSDFF